MTDKTVKPSPWSFTPNQFHTREVCASTAFHPKQIWKIESIHHNILKYQTFSRFTEHRKASGPTSAVTLILPSAALLIGPPEATSSTAQQKFYLTPRSPGCNSTFVTTHRQLPSVPLKDLQLLTHAGFPLGPHLTNIPPLDLLVVPHFHNVHSPNKPPDATTTELRTIPVLMKSLPSNKSSNHNNSETTSPTPKPMGGVLMKPPKSTLYKNPYP